MSPTGPDDLKRLGARLDDAQQRLAPRKNQPPPTQMGIAFRFSTELVAALVVGGAIGWGLDWLFGYFGIHTKPWLLIVFVVLGAAAGIRNVMRAATEINAQVAAQGPAPAARDDEES
ncbi:MAG TPA: AtpZ/AtpI family protein [Rhizomicrobium sp.]|jgi:ATP synthase protein I